MRHLKSMFAQNSRYFNSSRNNSNILSDNFSTEIHGRFKKNNVTSFLVMFDYACHIYTNDVYFSQLILIKLWGLVRFRLFLYFHLGAGSKYFYSFYGHFIFMAAILFNVSSTIV